MILYDLARKLKRRYKAYAKEQAGRYLSPVRRLERVAPPSGGLYCAMTFDDGPSAMPTNPKRSEHVLTDDILDTLGKYGAKGTFDVIGTTEYNYPDEMGPTGTFTWGGVTYDHYPDFGQDHLAGVKNQPELVRRILDEGHEITSHTYRHILFGQNRIIYGKRKFYRNIGEVIDDLKTLDKLLLEQYGYAVKMSRPPHYIDKTCDGHSAYDAYRYMNYQYMAASFDGGGWQVSGDYKKDVQAMITPMERVLKEDASALNGHIIFQKDGCNMSRETPIADALDPQLKLLTERGYKIVTVSELLALSPFEDTPDTDPVHEAAKALVGAGYCVAHRNNTLQPDKPVTLGEFLMMAADPNSLLAAYRGWADNGFSVSAKELELSRAWRVKPNHPYFHAFVLAGQNGWISLTNPESLNPNTLLTRTLYNSLTDQAFAGKSPVPQSDKEVFTKRDILPLLAEALL